MFFLYCMMKNETKYIYIFYLTGERLEMRQNTKNVQNQNLRTEQQKKKFSEPEQPEPEPEHQPKNR